MAVETTDTVLRSRPRRREVSMGAFDPLVPALAFLVALTLVGHILLVRAFPQDRAFWRKADYAAIVVAGLALVSVSADAREESANTALTHARDQATIALRLVGWAIDFADRQYYCAPLWAASDPQAAADYEAACEWGKESTVALERLTANATAGGGFKPLDRDEFEDPPPLITEPGTAGWEFEKRISTYNETAALVTELEEQAEGTDLELLLLYLAPFFLAFSIATEITKVSASAGRGTEQRPAAHSNQPAPKT
jgi:hypothetical protein